MRKGEEAYEGKHERAREHDRCFTGDENLLHGIEREDDKIFHMLVILQTPVKYILHQAHDAQGHNGPCCRTC